MYLYVHIHIKTLTHAAKGQKGLSCFEKQTAKHFLKLKKFKIWVFLGNYM